ncbi:MAG: gluconate 2-dehydrogenase subunit 3 family protein [Bryobacteraceae bacterium]
MKRRHFVTAMAAAAPAAAAAQQTGAPAASPASSAADGLPNLEITAPDAAAAPVRRFFSERQMQTLHRLADLLMPASSNVPGALQAQAPEFLDFLIGQSPADRKHVYLTGLDLLEQAARERHGKSFAELSAAETDPLLQPLRKPWTYELPSDPLEHFLTTAKHDIRTATLNSREWNEATSGGGRRIGGIGQYWHPID